MRELEIMVEETEWEIDRLRTLMESPEIACDYVKLNEINDKLMIEERKLEEYLENYVKHQDKIEETD